jgi:hypothetical protein
MIFVIAAGESILAFLQANAPKARCHADALPFDPLWYTEVAAAIANAIGHAKFCRRLPRRLICTRFRRFRGDEFLKARIIPQRIEHWVEPEQRRSERHV